MHLSEVIQCFFFYSSSLASSPIAFMPCLDLYLLVVEQALFVFHVRTTFSILSVKATLWVITLFLYSPSILSDSLVQGNKRWLAHMLYPPSILSDSFVQGNKRWFLDKRWLAHMLPLLISLETCVIIKLLPNVKKSEWDINGTLHGSRNNWSNTRHIESCVCFICNKEDTASVSL